MPPSTPPDPAGIGHQRAGALQHLARRPAREGEQHDALGRHALRDQPGDARAERGGLARAGAGQDQQGPAGMGGGGALLGIEPREPGTACQAAAETVPESNTRSASYGGARTEAESEPGPGAKPGPGRGRLS